MSWWVCWCLECLLTSHRWKIQSCVSIRSQQSQELLKWERTAPCVHFWVSSTIALVTLCLPLQALKHQCERLVWARSTWMCTHTWKCVQKIISFCNTLSPDRTPKFDLPWAWLKHSYSKQAPFLPICCLNWCCYCGMSLASPGLGKHCHLESSRQMSPLSHDRIPLILGIPSHGCLLLNELLLSTQLNGVVRNWKLSLLQLLLWQDFFQQFAAFDSVWNTCCSPDTTEASLKLQMS